MQNQSNEMPKIIGLSVAILVVLGAIVWQYTRATQPQTPTGPNPAITNTLPGGQPAASYATGTPPLTPAGGPGAARQAGPGQVRLFTAALDSEPGEGNNLDLQPGRANAFRTFKPPRTDYPQVTRTFPTFDQFRNSNRKGNEQSFSQPPGDPVIPPPPEPPMDVKLDGVVLGTPREAVLTIVERGSGAKSAGSEKTIYLKVGEVIRGHTITGINEAGLTMQDAAKKDWSAIWMVGQTRTFGGTRSVRTAETPGEGRGNLLPSGLIAMPPPPTLTP